MVSANVIANLNAVRGYPIYSYARIRCGLWLQWHKPWSIYQGEYELLDEKSFGQKHGTKHLISELSTLNITERISTDKLPN